MNENPGPGTDPKERQLKFIANRTVPGPIESISKPLLRRVVLNLNQAEQRRRILHYFSKRDVFSHVFPGDDDAHGEVADGVHLAVDGLVLRAHRVPPVLHLLDELLVEAEGVVLVLHHQRLQHKPQRLPYQLQVLHI